MVQEHIPFQLQDYLAAAAARLHALLSPYATITIDDKSSDYFSRSEAFFAVEAYLGASPCAAHARRLRADLAEGADRMALAVDDHEGVADDFRGATMWWRKTKALPHTNVITWSPRNAERRSYRLTFHRRHRALVENAYLPHVLAEGRAVTVRNRQRRLFTNNPSADWAAYDDDRVWSHVKLEHPSTFATLAMDPARKQEIIDDLDMFRDGKDYYASVGKPWKRGYLLFGPPGTGKSTMIAAMANFLDYDVYDLELTAVKSNTELRRLFIETTGKSIIVIEDIDCSIDLTGKRKKKKKKKNKESDKRKKMMPPSDDDDEEKKVTLSGLLNFIDGLWSACGGERIIIFTTNHKEKLDPALIRRGRMDMHIEMSYCRFEAFKVLAKNYLGVEQHEVFGEIRRLLEEVDMSPADVAENLMPRSKTKDVDACLGRLAKALHEAKEAALIKAEAAAAGKKANEGSDGDDDSSSSSKHDSDKDRKDTKEE
uniref:AAA+ ATPase domain-containing protein n=1 Tax=Oryza punctata TaxID=4537 RepID=A0A0E0MQ39_ORYPU